MKKSRTKYLTLILFLFCILHINSHSSNINISGSLYGRSSDFFNFSSEIVKGATFEWKIQNVEKTGSFEEIQINNSDTITIEVVDIDEVGVLTKSYISYIYTNYSYGILINGKNLSEYEDSNIRWYLYSGLHGPNFYQYAFGFSSPVSLNIYEPIYLFPTEYKNGSTIYSYFDMFYETLNEMASNQEELDVISKNDGKYIEIVWQRNFTMSLETEKYYQQILSINTEVGLLSYYKYYYESIDKLNSSNTEKLTYEIFSKKFGPREYRVGINPGELFFISLCAFVCIIYIAKKRNK